MDPVSPQPSPVARAWFALGLAGLLLVPTVVVALVLAGRDGAGTGHTGPGVAALDLASVPAEIAAHYEYAVEHESAFRAIPCFCGCEEFLAHRHLYDCFLRADGAGWEAHAAGCGVCIAEAAMARDLLEAGRPAGEVVDAVVARFGTTPITAPIRS